jgi:hypothetical protein
MVVDPHLILGQNIRSKNSAVFFKCTIFFTLPSLLFCKSSSLSLHRHSSEDLYVRKINGAFVYCIWTRNIFRVPITILKKETFEVELGITDTKYKYKALFLSTGYKLCNQHTYFTKQWITHCFQFADIKNPPNINAVSPEIRIRSNHFTRIELPPNTRRHQPKTYQQHNLPDLTTTQTHRGQRKNTRRTIGNKHGKTWQCPSYRPQCTQNGAE